MGSKAALLFMPKEKKTLIQTISLFGYFVEPIKTLQKTFIWFLPKPLIVYNLYCSGFYLNLNLLKSHLSCYKFEPKFLVYQS